MNERSFYIFGAHSRGQTTRIYLKALYPEWRFLGYLYDNEEENPEEIDAEPVWKIGDRGVADKELDTSACVYIGTRGVFHAEIKDKLANIGFSEIIPIDVAYDTELRNKFIPDYYARKGWNFRRLESALTIANDKNSDCISDTSVYVVRSAFDAPLAENVPIRPFEKTIQAGTSLTRTLVSECNIFDDYGDNISERNKQFCELTALYWIWKNDKSHVVGIEHYRRRFLLPAGWERVFEESNYAPAQGKVADVILPVPLYVYPGLRDNYCNRHTPFTWDAMMRALSELHPECVNVAARFFEKTGCYSPCNMLIARKLVFDELCSWLFPVLFKTVERCGNIDDAYQNRYPGFLAERLITFFFYYNSDKYNVVYADKSFLGG